MRSLVRAALVFAILTTPALAAKAPPLPASAEKLDAARIVALYDGKTFSFTTYTFFGVATGTVTYDFKTKTNHGSYQMGWHHGAIEGQIRMDGDKFCYKVKLDSEHCDFVYVAGNTVYDVDPGGTVRSVNVPK